MRGRSGFKRAVSSKFLANFITYIEHDESWNGRTQEDAAEFQGVLLDRLEKEEMADSKASSPESTEVHRLFRSEIKQSVSKQKSILLAMEITDRTKIGCSGCGHTSGQTSGSRSLTLDLPQGVFSAAFQTVLGNHFKPEPLSGHSCGGCGEMDLTSKTYRLSDLPQYLLVTINRFQVVEGRRGRSYVMKNRAKISVATDDLDLTDICDPSCASPSKSYSICGMVEHRGAS